MDETAPGRNGPGCLIACIVVVAVSLAAAAVGAAAFIRNARDPGSSSYRVMQFLKGEKSADELATEIIIGRLTEAAGVPPRDRAALEAEMQPIARELPSLSEGEKHKLAMIIREAVADGRVTPDDLARIREYSSRSARDGDARP